MGFAFDEALQRYSIFSLSDHSYLTLTEENFGRISEARTTDANMEVKNWLNTLDPHPTVNGHVIELEPHDMSRSLAIAPGGSRALLGTSYRLRCVDSNGAEVWNHLTPGEAFAVNISGDGRFGIVAFTDGTIRWFRMTDGTPLLAFFPLNDGDLEATMENQPEWVIWAPDTGHFRCSPNGAQLIGWQVNRGSRDDPDFYSADQLYDTLEDWQGILGRVLEECRPAKEIIRDLVAAGDMEEPETLEEVLQGVPEVQLEGIADLETSPTNWTTMTVRAQQTDPQIGITAIKLFVNGVPMRSNHPMNRLTKGEASQKFEVRLLRGKNEIRAVAYNRQRVSSFPATRRVFFEGPKPTSHLWVLGVGLEDYSNPKFNLDWCVRDISKSIDVLRSRGEALFLDRHVVTLSNDLATRSAIEEAFSSLKERIQPEDTFVFLYAGHGTVNRQGEFHLVTHDVPEFSDGAELSERAIPASVLRRLMNEVPAQKRVMLLDACHSGAVVRSFAISPSTAEEVAIAQLSRGTGTAILASSSADEMSRSSRDLGHGYFTWTFLEGLGEGKADGGTGDGKISVLELTSYINGRLPIVTAGTDPAKPRPPQFPRSFLSPWFQDFPIGSVEQP
ncbi:MAG: caspase family protein [Verrucomicrobiota bacterium]